MVFLNKKRNRFMKRNVVIVSQQSSSMRNIKKIRPGGVFQQQHIFFLSNYVGRKKKMLFFVPNGFAFNSVWSN